MRPKRRRPPRRKTRALLGFVIGLLGVPLAYHVSRPSSPAWEVEASDSARSAPSTDEPQLRDGYSNIHPTDYVGPEACAECHEKQYRLWRSHPHRLMNQDASDASVQGDFEGRTLSYGDLEARFERQGSAFTMSLHSDGVLRRRYRVTRTVGSRFTQMYIGLQTHGPEPPAHSVYGAERKLPFGYWTTRDRWLPANYFDSDFQPDYSPADDTPDVERLFRANHWERNCIYCHNTYPYVARLRSGLDRMSGFPRGDLRLSGDRALQRRLSADTLVTLGISCESCHFGGREHVENDEAIRFVPTAPDLIFGAAGAALVEGARDSPYVVNSICAQCHAAEGVSLYPNGAGTWNSREALDLFAGSCSEAIRCTDCHEPHTPGPAGGGPDSPAHLKACVRCHTDRTGQQHSRHGPEVSCLDCHMPRIVQGLDAVVRSHLISSPADTSMLGQASPNACNLCHLDRSIRWTLSALARDYRPIAIGDWSAAHGGDLDRPLGEVWREHRVPITRLIATDAYARAGNLEAVLPGLEDASPVNRMFALFAVEALLGRQLGPGEYTPTAPARVRRTQVARLLRLGR